MKGSDKAGSNYVHKLDFTVRDVFRSARCGLNPRNVWVCWKGLLSAWLTWTFFVYAGFLAAGDNISERISTALLCPLPDRLFISSVPAVILLAAGVLAAVFILLYSALKVSRMTFEQLRGDQFYTEKDAGDFAAGNWKPLVLTPLTIITGLAVGVGILALTGLTCRIPAAGPWIMSILAVPSWMLGVLLVYTLLVLLLSFFLVPAIIASTSGDGFECIFELFSITTSQPFRVIRGVLAGLLSRIPVLLAVLLFSWAGLALSGALLDWTGGVPGTAFRVESGLSTLAPDLVPFYSSIFSPVSSSAGTATGFSGVPGIILSASGVAIMLAVSAFWFSSCAAMWQLIYLGVRHARDGEDLLMRAEEDEYREFRKLYGSTDHAGDRQSR